MYNYEFLDFLPADQVFFNTSRNITASNVSVVIPIRGRERQSALNACIWNWLRCNDPTLEIIVSEEDDAKKIDISEFVYAKNVKHIFTSSNTLFNKSRAINRGVSVSANSTIIMNDVDILVPNNFLEKFKRLPSIYEFFFFANDILYADLRDNKIVHNQDRWSKHADRYPFVGGNIAFDKRAFHKIGGMYEGFVGYGSEDGEFYTRAKKARGTRFLEKRSLPLIHINHEYVQSNSNNVMRNFDLYQKLKAMPITKRIEVVTRKIIL